MACCQIVDQEVLDTDGEHFDCESCPMPTMLASLDAANEDAWAVYGQLCSRFAVDFNLAPELLRHLTDGRPADDVLDLVDRLAVMYDILSPPQSRQG